MAARIIATIVLSASQIVFKAFGEAYRKGMQNAAKGGANAVKRRGKAGPAGSISTEAAATILDIPKNKITPAEIAKRYDHLFKANDPAKGGSLYIRAKVTNAKAALEEALKNKTL
ncbi:uncharacterized protein AMSG_02822 [Thecamonas trahens ATCC 50062]|uniref:Mitochondrial import inner membrane translocase subunit TIM16 n=1 Tax=Thecamonas trahens ATCC 50062 TaxID=461836 RepID=A0A0L0D2I6_THETB|nr:hypothetical protein AMSG_02822 [Thecamonas trahens ATCC 50062]KNC46370.1 hypothetical protein AMSG_02822 [Thecamonas trahens ATCC 50062]|eukprot:XP_013760663.1 hypothetical protein AMSG_02822 [Thecamonas trahens ATCC 50062]